MKKFFLSLLLVLGIALPLSAQAAIDLDPIGNNLGQGKSFEGMGFVDLTAGDGGGEDTAIDTLRAIFRIGRDILGSLAILFLILGAVKMATAQSEDEVGKGREIITDTLITLVFITAAPLLVDIFFQGGESQVIGSTVTSPIEMDGTDSRSEFVIYQQLYEIMNFILLIMIPVMIGMMLYYGALHIFSIGDADWLKKEQRAMAWSLGGLSVILFAKVVVSVFLGSFAETGVVTQNSGINTSLAFSEAIGFINTLLYVAGGLAVAMLIYAGYMMLMAGENEDEFDKAKKQITYTIIGLVIIFSSWIIVSTFTTGSTLIS